MKLGYSERLVQLALGRFSFGNPSNNELLAELIKLGAQPGSNGKAKVKIRTSKHFLISSLTKFYFSLAAILINFCTFSRQNL